MIKKLKNGKVKVTVTINNKTMSKIVSSEHAQETSQKLYDQLIADEYLPKGKDVIRASLNNTSMDIAEDYIFPYIGDSPFRNITPEFINFLLEINNPTIALKIKQIFKTASDYAYKEAIIDKSPMLGVMYPYDIPFEDNHISKYWV